jgi:hypothetical protein
MKRLWIAIDLLLLTVILAVSLGAEPVAAAKALIDADVSGEQDIEVLRHNYFVYLQSVKADVSTGVESAMEQSVQDAGFIRHNYGVRAWVTTAEVTFERMAQEIDFLRHNTGTHAWDAQVDAGKPLPTQGGEDRIEYRQHRR